MDFVLRVRTAAVFILFSSMFKLHQCPKVSNRVRVRKLCGPYQDLDGISLFPGNAHTTSVSSWNIHDSFGIRISLLADGNNALVQPHSIQRVGKLVQISKFLFWEASLYYLYCVYLSCLVHSSSILLVRFVDFRVLYTWRIWMRISLSCMLSRKIIYVSIHK